MRLHRSQLASLSRQIVKSLVDAEDIEIADRREVERDVESVLTSYLNESDRVMTRARELVQQRGLPQGEFARLKQLAAEQAGIKVGDDALDYLLDQLVTMLMHSASVEEVFAEDHVLKRRMREHLRAEEELDRDIEAEVRSKLKHVEEGSRVWEIEYERMKSDIKRRRGVE
jgi:uncharacterized protein